MLEENIAKRNARQNYELASNIATLVGFSMGGKKGQRPPSLYTLYPELFAYEKEVEDYNVISSEGLRSMMQEAERIMEGWENPNE